ncbi:hypothetical protein LEP1GSC112_0892 [Leptospira interrogans serovar Pomona str. UT364]|nr:hypothetical protein LEP1GSC112_0892 [Leptospira interrogans serovar Pomona str. UT364]
MFDVKIQFGAIYHIQSKKRHDVEFSDHLEHLPFKQLRKLEKY